MNSPNESADRDRDLQEEVVRRRIASKNGDVLAGLSMVDEAIAEYERDYGMSSDDARRLRDDGFLPSSLDVDGWMIALRVRDEIAREAHEAGVLA